MTTRRPWALIVFSCIGLLLTALLVAQPLAMLAPILRGYADLFRNHPESAHQNLAHALEVAPIHNFSARQASHFELESGDTDKAVARLESAYAYDPANMLTQYDLLGAYWQAGHYAKMEQLWQHISPPAAQLEAVSFAYILQGNLSNAAPWLEHIIQTQGAARPGAMFQLGLANLKRNPQARLRAQKLLEAAGAASVTPDPVLYKLPESAETVLRIDGGKLWTTYNQTASYSVYPAIGVLWNPYLAGIAATSTTTGTYRISASLKHSAPAPAHYSIEIDGQVIGSSILAKGDWSWETTQLIVKLPPGLHIIGVRFTNADNQERAGFVELLDMQRIDKDSS